MWSVSWGKRTRGVWQSVARRWGPDQVCWAASLLNTRFSWARVRPGRSGQDKGLASRSFDLVSAKGLWGCWHRGPMTRMLVPLLWACLFQFYGLRCIPPPLPLPWLGWGQRGMWGRSSLLLLLFVSRTFREAHLGMGSSDHKKNLDMLIKSYANTFQNIMQERKFSLSF